MPTMCESWGSDIHGRVCGACQHGWVLKLGVHVSTRGAATASVHRLLTFDTHPQHHDVGTAIMSEKHLCACTNMVLQLDKKKKSPAIS